MDSRARIGDDSRLASQVFCDGHGVARRIREVGSHLPLGTLCESSQPMALEIRWLSMTLKDRDEWCPRVRFATQKTQKTQEAQMKGVAKRIDRIEESVANPLATQGRFRFRDRCRREAPRAATGFGIGERKNCRSRRIATVCERRSQGG